MQPKGKRQYRKRKASNDEEKGGNDGSEGKTSDAVDIIRDALELRRLRRKQNGVDSQELLRGDPVVEALNQKKEEGLKEKFIEKELKKRQKSAEPEDDAGAADPPSASVQLVTDPNELLYQIPEHLRVAAKPVQEGNVTLSTTMLTAIPEIDLGIDSKLRNIEDTEKAKRRLIEGKNKRENPESFVGSSQAAADR
ncbi:hypothetical protein HDU93_005102, partial [Gonapodya sp. JEL0774]